MPPKFPKIDLIRQTLGASRAGSSARSRMRRFFDAREGMVAPILGFLLLPLGMSVGVAVDYAKAVKARTIFVAAVDASALAGVKAMYDGMPQDQVRTHVAKVLKSAAGPYAGSVTLDAIVPTTENTALTASVYASLDLPLNFPKLTGSALAHSNHQSIAQVYTGGAGGPGHGGATGSLGGGGSGVATVTGDPEVYYPDGSSGYVDCPAGNWLNALSDSKIQVNFACTYAPVWGNLIRYMTVLAGDHVITYDMYQGAAANVRDGNRSSIQWPADITIDGRKFVPASNTYGRYDPNIPYQTALDSDGVKVTVQPSWSSDYNLAATGMYTYQRVKVTSGAYTLELSYYTSEMVPWGTVKITTSDAGTCGQAGGLLGASFNGEKIGDSVRSAWQYNQAYSAYIVPGRAYKDARFYWTSDCASSAEIVRAGVPRLIK